MWNWKVWKWVTQEHCWAAFGWVCAPFKLHNELLNHKQRQGLLHYIFDEPYFSDWPWQSKPDCLYLGGKHISSCLFSSQQIHFEINVMDTLWNSLFKKAIFHSHTVLSILRETLSYLRWDLTCYLLFLFQMHQCAEAQSPKNNNKMCHCPNIFSLDCKST